MSKWNTSNYLERKAARRALVRPEWFINPETKEEFFLRPADSLMSNVLAAYLPNSLTQVALEAWKQQGVEGLSDAETMTAEIASRLTPDQLKQGDEEMQATSLAIQQLCIIPFISASPVDQIEFTKEWRADAVMGLKQKDPKFNEGEFDPKDYVLHPKLLDGSDTQFLYKFARGLVGTTPLRGGNVANMSDVERFRVKPARGARTKPDKQKVRESA